MCMCSGRGEVCCGKGDICCAYSLISMCVLGGETSVVRIFWSPPCVCCGRERLSHYFSWAFNSFCFKQYTKNGQPLSVCINLGIVCCRIFYVLSEIFVGYFNWQLSICFTKELSVLILYSCLFSLRPLLSPFEQMQWNLLGLKTKSVQQPFLHWIFGCFLCSLLLLCFIYSKLFYHM